MAKEGQLAKPAYGKYALPERDGTSRDLTDPDAEVVRYPYVPAPRRVETEAAAFEPAASDGAAEELVRSRSEVYRLTGLDAARLRPFFVAGPAMEPEIRANTAVLYLPQDRFDASGIYVVALDGVEVVRVADLLGGGAFELSNLNVSLFPRPEVFTPLEDAAPGCYRSDRTDRTCRVTVLGRVVLYTKGT